MEISEIEALLSQDRWSDVSRRAMQIYCKHHGLRADGKNEDMQARIIEHWTGTARNGTGPVQQSVNEHAVAASATEGPLGRRPADSAAVAEPKRPSRKQSTSSLLDAGPASSRMGSSASSASGSVRNELSADLLSTALASAPATPPRLVDGLELGSVPSIAFPLSTEPPGSAAGVPPSTARVSSPLHPSDPELRALAAKMKQDREQISLMTQPLRTVGLCLEELFSVVARVLALTARHLVVSSLFALACWCAVVYAQEKRLLERYVYEIDYAEDLVEWIVLGVMSSIGLGTGLHTFLLNLGPYIVQVTRAAASCGNLDFDMVGPAALQCKQLQTDSEVGLPDIWTKVAPMALAWGLGTALGELPPYFVARGAREQGETVEALEGLQQDGLLTRLFRKLTSGGGLKFWHILLLASFPNPLFDLAGIVCGYYGVSFWTFFGATAIGKAILKANMQSVFVIAVFQEASLQLMASAVSAILPSYGKKFQEFVEKEKRKYDSTLSASLAQPEPTLFSMAWDTLLTLLILSFAVGVINVAARARQRTKDERDIQELRCTAGAAR